VATAELAPDNVISPSPGEEPEIKALVERIEEIGAKHQRARLVGPRGEAVPIPVSAFEALRKVIHAMSQGMTVTLVPHGKELTSKQAADLLHVSRPFLVRNLLGRDIPFHKVGTHRRIYLDDVLAYREQRARERRRLLDEMTAAGQEVEGGYR
jgi:excisionase family DNA binding protein